MQKMKWNDSPTWNAWILFSQNAIADNIELGFPLKKNLQDSLI